MTDTEQIVPAAEEIQGAPVEETAAPVAPAEGEAVVVPTEEAPAEEVAPQA